MWHSCCTHHGRLRLEFVVKLRLSDVGVYDSPVPVYRVTTGEKERAENMALRSVGSVARRLSSRIPCFNGAPVTSVANRSFHGTASTFDVLSLGQVRLREHNIYTKMNRALGILLSFQTRPLCFPSIIFRVDAELSLFCL